MHAAAKAGYKVSPLTTALMSRLRKSNATTFRGVLAAIDISESDRSPHGPFPREIVAGARHRAKELGFKLEEFVVGGKALLLPRLNTIFKSRGIHGVMLLPAWHAPDLSGFDWTRYAGVYTDCVIERPALNTVCPDHYRSVTGLMERLFARGYRRPGLMIEQGRDERLQLRQSGAFRAFVESHAEIDPLPILFPRSYNFAEFCPWFIKHKPDVVISHFDETVDWMKACGARVPDDHGYVCLNVINRTRPCASLDLQPRRLGATAAELLVSQLQRDDIGPPPYPTTTMLAATWIEGPTLPPPVLPG